MRVLVYGFGPYRGFRSNITQKIVRRLAAARDLRKIVFPVRFDSRQFTDAVRKYRPEVILGLGQCSTGRKLRIERRAVNLRRNDRRGKGRPISRGGPATLTSTIGMRELGLGKRARMSRSAGDYVCNFSMYVILDHLRRGRGRAKFGFVHIPHRYPLGRAYRLIRQAIRGLARG